MSLITQAVTILEQEDPAVGIRHRVKDMLDDIRIGGQDLLVAVYEPAKNAKSSGGIYLPDKVREEYRWQGCTGLVLKIGPLAYRTERTEGWFANNDGEPDPPKVGDWIMFDIKVSNSFLLGKQPCRFVACQYVMGIVARPDMVA